MIIDFEYTRLNDMAGIVSSILLESQFLIFEGYASIREQSEDYLSAFDVLFLCLWEYENVV